MTNETWMTKYNTVRDDFKNFIPLSAFGLDLRPSGLSADMETLQTCVIPHNSLKYDLNVIACDTVLSSCVILAIN